MTIQQLRDLARRVASLTDDELDQVEGLLTGALDDIARSRAQHETDRAAMYDDDPAREWATESTVGTVCSDESLAIARTVTAERSDPYETVVVDVGEGGERR